MIRAKIYLPKYDWVIFAYIAVHEYYTYEILERMRSIGADNYVLARAYKNLTAGELNNGLTFTNTKIGVTVWVTEITSSAAEFFNSIVHEIRHLQQHIADAYGIEPDGEEVCYMCGEIALRLFPYCRELLCEHCREHGAARAFERRRERQE